MLALSDKCETIIRQMEDAGFRTDAVGGCVRDMLMGKTPHDYDLTSSATVEQMKSLFAGERLILTGEKHGTVTLVRGGEPFEITTWRIDGDYADSRHPDRVTFTTSLEEDLARRDFTVNAMAYHPSFGLTDLYGGQADLERKIIRTVGDPARRFSEDALRILRGMRFSSVLGFEIEENTAQAMHALKQKLSAVSAQRIDTEFMKLLGGVRAAQTVKEFSDICEIFMPHVLSTLPDTNVLNRDFSSLTDKERLVYLFARCEKPCTRWGEFCDSLLCDNRRRRFGSDVLSRLTNEAESRESILRHLYVIGEEATVSMLRLKEIIYPQTRGCSEILSLCLEEKAPYRISDLAIGGSDLAALGLKGKEIGRTLETLLFALMSGKCENTKEALTDYIRRI